MAVPDQFRQRRFDTALRKGLDIFQERPLIGELLQVRVNKDAASKVTGLLL